MAFSILYVCTGNVCRSPFAELLTRARLDAALGAGSVEVASAGTRGLAGHPMDPAAAAQLRTRGVDAEGFRARELSNAMIKRADLVLTATKAHRQAVLTEEPRALRRTFTIRELADIVKLAEPAATPQALVARAATLRGRATLADYDVPDPIGGSDELHARVAATVTEALDPILEAVVAAVLRAAD